MLRGEVGNVISQNAVLAEIYGCPKSKSPAAVTMSKPSAPVKIVVESKSPIKSQSKFPGRHAKEPKTFIIGSSPHKRKPPVKVCQEPVKKPGLFVKCAEEVSSASMDTWARVPPAVQSMILTSPKLAAPLRKGNLLLRCLRRLSRNLSHLLLLRTAPLICLTSWSKRWRIFAKSVEKVSSIS